MVRREQYQGVLLLTAVGDMLGAPVESLPAWIIRKRIGSIRGPLDPNALWGGKGVFAKSTYWHIPGLRYGDVTDDTMLTIPVAESLVACKGYDLMDCAQRQLAAYEQHPDQGFGKTTKDGFARLKQGFSPLESGGRGKAGNAPPMKMSPVGLYMATHAEKEGLAYARLLGMMTHRNPHSVAAGMMQAYAISLALQGVAFKDVLTTIQKKCRASELALGARKAKVADGIGWVLTHEHADVAEARTVLRNSSRVYESYPFTLFMFQRYAGSLEGMLACVESGGDCDSTAALYGAFRGAYKGLAAPKDWVNLLVDKERLLTLGSALYDLR